ncbi:MAG: presenilin family intramembrane aspartyl protease PSH [Thermoplasmata archaeon]
MASVRSFGLLLLYIGAQIVALALALPFRAQGLTTNANPTSPASPLYLIVLIIGAPLVILFIARYKGGLAALRYVILVGIAGSLTFTLPVAFSVVDPNWFFLPPAEAGFPFVPYELFGILFSVLIFEALLLDPQWYIVDLAGFVAAGALIALLGISFAILPVFLLLIALAIYDAVAVYVTRHMVSLAEVVTDLKLPILMVMPERSGYDYTKNKGFMADRGRPVEDREATFMGLGDVVFPGILVVAAYVWLPAAPVFLHVGANLWIAVGALLGSLAGYAVLMRRVRSGHPQAGLPFLNGGVLAGYVLTYVLFLHSFSLGISWTF